MAKSGCPVPKGAENYGDRGTSWQTMSYIALASMGFTSTISLALIFQHLRRYRAPKEQRQIIRIIFSVVAYSVVAFFELRRYEDAQYVDPLGDVYEAFGLCALFLLFIQYASPSGTFDEATFDAVLAAEESETATAFNWAKISWIFVFQYPIVEVVCVGIQEATEAAGVFCTQSLSPKFAHLYVELLVSVSIGACVIAIWKFRQKMKSLMKAKRGMSKILLFKIIVLIRFAQQWVFSLLLQYHAIKPGPVFNYNDILYGIPATATCIEMVLFSAGFWYAFSASEYSSTAKPHVKALPIWKAVLDALNPMDFILGVGRIFPLCIELSKSGDWKKYRTAAKDQGLTGAVRKGVKKYKARTGKGPTRYQELNESIEPMTKPSESHQSMDFGRNSMNGGGAAMYQPPQASPPYEAGGYSMAEIDGSGHRRASSQQYLMTDTAAPGRPRASSQSSLMEESRLQQGRPNSMPGGYTAEQRYDRSRSPSPARFGGAPVGGREML